MEEKKTLGEWAITQDIRLLDTKFYEDKNLYTLKEYGEIVPRNIEVPLNLNSNECVGSMEELLQELKDLKSQQDSLKEKETEIKAKLESEYLTEEGYKSEYITVSYSQPSVTTTVDLAKMQKEEPELYEDLLRDYPKVTNRKASFSYRFK